MLIAVLIAGLMIEGANDVLESTKRNKAEPIAAEARAYPFTAGTPRLTEPASLADARLILPDVQGATAPEAARELGHGGLDGGAMDGGGASQFQGVEAELREGGGVAFPDSLAATLPYVTAPTGAYIRFFEGYRDAGGQYPEARIDAMIFCESSWRLDPGGSHLGLAQFDPGTWATVSAITSFADPYNPYHQGFNVAVWASMISPGTSAGWPNCFSAIDW